MNTLCQSNIKELLEVLRNMTFRACSAGLLQKNDIFGLTFIQRSALIFISQNNRIRMVELGRLLCLHKSAVTRVVDSLEKEGFVNRVVADEKRRGYILALTQKGKNIINKLDKEPLEILTKILSDSSHSEREFFHKGFKLFLDKLENTVSI